MKKFLLSSGIVLAIFLVVSGLFFLPQLQGKKIYQNDVVMHKSSAYEALDFYDRTGERALWTNSMFGGMPTYQISLPKTSNLTFYVHKVFGNGLGYPIGMIVIAMLSFYVLARVLELEFWTSIICSIAFALTTNNIVLIEAGHNTKVIAVYLLGITTAGIFHAFKGKWLEGSILFAFGLGYNLFINHPQMTYYYGLTLLILGVILLIKYLKENKLAEFIKPASGLIVGALLAVGASTTGLWTTLEYSKASMRGQPILKTQNTQTSSSAVEGLDWQYAMNWSNGGLDVLAGFIPGIVGGGSQEPVATSSESYKAFRQSKSPLYWGALPFTSGPAYLGCVMVFLFVLGLLLKNTRYKWWIGLSVLLTLLLSMGKNFESFNRFFFDYFPVYNKFRAPSSITSVTAFFIPLLAAIVLSDIVKEKIDKEELLQKGKITLGLLGAVCLFFAFMGPSFFDFISAGDARYPQQVQDALIADRKALLTSDSLRVFAFITVAGLAIWAYTKNMVKSQVLLGIIGALVVFDIWTIDRRYVNDENWSNANAYEQNFAMRPVDQQILQDQDPHYRVADFSVAMVGDARPARYHKILGGYHGAKLQRANDLILNYISQGNQAVLGMMNAKYIIQGQKGQEQVSSNPQAFGNAWFVEDIQLVGSAEEEFSRIANITPESAVVHNEYSEYINNLNPSKNGSVRLTTYTPNKLTYQSNSDSEQLALFSEMWYTPGWEASIDGQPVDHIRANYALRALKVPAGNHEIVFNFQPKSYYTGNVISMASSSIIFIGLGWMLFTGFRRIKEEELEENVEKVSKTIPKPKAIRKKKKTKKKTTRS